MVPDLWSCSWLASGKMGGLARWPRGFIAGRRIRPRRGFVPRDGGLFPQTGVRLGPLSRRFLCKPWRQRQAGRLVFGTWIGCATTGRRRIRLHGWPSYSTQFVALHRPQSQFQSLPTQCQDHVGPKAGRRLDIEPRPLLWQWVRCSEMGEKSFGHIALGLFSNM